MESWVNKRNKEIEKYIYINTDKLRYYDGQLIPQISYSQLQYVRDNIEKYFNENLNYIEYGVTGQTTVHSLCKVNNITYIVITHIHNNEIVIRTCFKCAGNFIKDFYYSGVDKNDMTIVCIDGCWKNMNDN
jgi:hypothetical protein